MKTGAVIWMTGLSGSGKTTIAKQVEEVMKAQDRPLAILDGDEVRRDLSSDLGFSAEDREKHNRRVIFVAKILARNGVNVVIPLISPYRKVREFAREQLPNFSEIWVRAPLAECIKRDPKGLYAKALRGEITNMTGLQDPYEEPLKPEMTIDTDKLPLAQCVSKVVAEIDRLQDK